MPSALALKAKDGVAPYGAGSMQFYLPVMPVPLHACFKNVAKRGRADTPRYKAFKRTVDKWLHVMGHAGTERAPRFLGPVRVHYIVCRPDKRQRDLDNLTKSLGDLLKRNHILGDDSQIVDLRIGWTLEEMKEPVLVQVEAA